MNFYYTYVKDNTHRKLWADLTCSKLPCQSSKAGTCPHAGGASHTAEQKQSGGQWRDTPWGPTTHPGAPQHINTAMVTLCNQGNQITTVTVVQKYSEPLFESKFQRVVLSMFCYYQCNADIWVFNILLCLQFLFDRTKLIIEGERKKGRHVAKGPGAICWSVFKVLKVKVHILRPVPGILSYVVFLLLMLSSLLL